MRVATDSDDTKNSGHITPQPYSGASLTLYRTGTKSNSTHWQFTALCQGCTSYSIDGGAMRYLTARGGNRLAFAYSPSRPSSSSATGSIMVHEVHAYWNHDFAAAANADFEGVVGRLQV